LKFKQGSVYLLLCDVTPGKTKVLDKWDSASSDFPPKNIDSILAVGRIGPNSSADVRLSTSGLSVPVGAIETREKYLGYGFDELVVYNEKRVAIRYVVKLAGQVNV
jgi:hypothetical protein